MFILLMILAGVIQGQPSMLIGGQKDERANVIVRAFNPVGGYVMAGWTRSFSNGTPGAMKGLIVRTNAVGSPISPAVLTAGILDEEVTSMVAGRDNCYVLTGWTRNYKLTPTSFESADIFVIKLNANLSLVWAKVYHLVPDDLDHKAYSIIECGNPPHGGYALTGWVTHGDNKNGRRVIVLRLTATGNVMWVRTYQPGNSFDEGNSICEVNSSDAPNVKFAVVGCINTSIPAQKIKRDAFLLRLDQNGIPIGPTATTIFNGKYDEEARSAVWDRTGGDPGIVVSGWTRSIGEETQIYSNVWVAKFRAQDGLRNWSYSYHWNEKPDLDETVLGDKSLILTSGTIGNGYALTGFTYSRGSIPPDNPTPNVLLMRLDYNGNVGWAGNVSVHPSIPLNNKFDVGLSLVQAKYTTAAGNIEDAFTVAGGSNSFNPPSPANLDKENFLFTVFRAIDGTRPTGCAIRFIMVKIPFNWSTKYCPSFTNAASIRVLELKMCTLTGMPICMN